MSSIGNFSGKTISGSSVQKRNISFNASNTINYTKRSISNTEVSSIDFDMLTDEIKRTKTIDIVKSDLNNIEESKLNTFIERYTNSTINKIESTVVTFLMALNDGAISLTEKIADGAIWSTKLLFNAQCFKATKTISAIKPEYTKYAEQTDIMIDNFFKDVIAFEADSWFQNWLSETKVFREINDKSYFDYTGTGAQKVRNISEGIQKKVGAAISSKVWGGALAILLGGCYGSGVEAEKLYQQDKNTTVRQEASILFNGMREAASWFATAKLASKFLNKTPASEVASETGTSMAEKGKALFEHLKTRERFKFIGTHVDAIKTTFQELFKGNLNPFTKYLGQYMSKPENIVSIANSLNRNLPEYVSGEKEITFKSVMSDINLSFTKMVTGSLSVDVNDNNTGGDMNIAIFGILKALPLYDKAINLFSPKETSNPDIVQQNTSATISIAGINPYSKSIK